MKKSSFIAMVLVVALVLMGAGYAAWTDRLSINTEIKTGYLDVSFADAATFTNVSELVTTSVAYSQDWNDPGATADQNNWDIANVSIGNMYPGATADVTLKMTNNGTIPVGMNAITDTRSANWGANGANFDQIGATLRYFTANGTAIGFANTTTYANPWEPAHLVDIKIPVGGYATITFNFKASDTIAEKTTYNFNVSAIFKQ